MPIPMDGAPGNQVFISSREGTCGECGAALTRFAWICPGSGQRGPCVCPVRLVRTTRIFFRPGDAALTRRAKQASGLWAVVLNESIRNPLRTPRPFWSRRRRCKPPEAACIADGAARRARPAAFARRKRRLRITQYMERFAEEVRRRYPGSCRARAHLR